MCTGVKESIVTVLGMNRRGVDVKVVLDKVPSGIWVWDELSKTHVQFHFEELADILGFSPELLDWTNDLDQYETSWRFINPVRLRAAAGT